MAVNYTGKNRRQFPDVFSQVATGFATSAGTAITNATQQTLAITIPDVALDGTWCVLAVLPHGAIAGCTLAAEITASGTVTVYIQNLTGGSQTPAAQQITVICAQIDGRYLTSK